METKPLSEYTKEELLDYIHSLKKQKKFGLVWEDKPERVAIECKEKLPVLSEDTSKAILEAPNQPTNIIIEGDNYHALSVLNYTHPEGIDIIYIDPPYNTGNKDFRYNDRYIDKEDSFRHSKWLSFIEKRIRLASDLLASDGVMFISIDDNEQAHLKLLVDEIFGEGNCEVMIWHKVDNDSGRLKITYRFRAEHEYVMVVYKNKMMSRHFNKYLKRRNYKNAYTNPDNDPRGEYKQGIISDTEAKSNKSNKNYYSITTPGGRVVTRKWRVPKEEFKKLVADNRIYFGKDGNSIPSLKVFINELGETTPTSILDELGTAKSAGISLASIFNEKVFSYPKPVELLKHLLQISTNKDDVILDFFAGSGTTGQAVMELNKEDGGNRQFILCTNNENKIAEEVTYPRIKTVTTGIRPDKTKYSDGIPANIRYFKTELVEKGVSNDQTRENLVNRVSDMIKIKENTFDLVFDEPEVKLFSDRKKMTAIIFDPFDMKKDWEIIEENNAENLNVNLYIFSYSSDTSAFTDEIPENTTISWSSKPIPEGIMKVYKRIFR